MKIKITNKYIRSVNKTDKPTFPKYTTQIINIANQNARGTRPKVVGQLSELLPEYLRECQSNNITPTLNGWKRWYTQKYPNAVSDALDKIIVQVENLKNCVNVINNQMIENWVKDLIYNKTFDGLYYQKAILQKIAEKTGKKFRLANPAEEAKGIDGYIGSEPYQIKPDSYDYMRPITQDNIQCKIIKYKKTKRGIEIEVDE